MESLTIASTFEERSGVRFGAVYDSSPHPSGFVQFRHAFGIHTDCPQTLRKGPPGTSGTLYVARYLRVSRGCLRG